MLTSLFCLFLINSSTMQIVNGEQPFSVTNNNFAVGPTSAGYTLGYSVDGASFTLYSDETPANEVLVVNGFPEGMIFKLQGNSDNNVKILD